MPARFSSKPLRIASLVMYSLVLIPGFNLILPFTFFLALHISYNWSRKRHESFWRCVDKAFGTISDILRMAFDAILRVFKSRRQTSTRDADDANPSLRTAFLIVGLVLLVVINVLFIVDIELTLRRNKSDQNGDDQWGFGQVLSLLLLIIPLRDAWGALQEIREKLKSVQEQLEKKQEDLQAQFEELLLRECQATPATVELNHLIDRGAKTESLTNDPRFASCLQQAAYHGKIDLVELLREKFEDKPGAFETALQSAAAGGHIPMVKFLQDKGFEDKPGVRYGTVLQAASARGHVPMVEFLLKIDKYVTSVNEVGGDYGTALCAACANGKDKVVNALLAAKAKWNVVGGQFGAHFTLLY